MKKSASEPPDRPEPDKPGPGNPPKKYRWRPGCPSPNPTGRPPTRKRQIALAPVDKIAELVERVGGLMTKGGDPIELRELAYRQLYDIALSKPEANPAATRLKISSKDRLAAIKLVVEIESKSARLLSRERQEQFDAAMDYKAYWAAKFSAAEKEGRALPPTVPHPEDLIAAVRRSPDYLKAVR
jgi:hypothetical protein